MADRFSDDPVRLIPQAVSRRLLLKSTAMTFTAAAFAFIAGCDVTETGAKVSKQRAEYQDAPKGPQKCGKCKYFIADENTCRKVEGDISPEGWCMLFAAKS